MRRKSLVTHYDYHFPHHYNSPPPLQTLMKIVVLNIYQNLIQNHLPVQKIIHIYELHSKRMQVMIEVTTLSLPKVSKCHMVNCVYTEICKDLNYPLAKKKMPFLFGPIKSKVSDSTCNSYTTEVISNNQLIVLFKKLQTKINIIQLFISFHQILQSKLKHYATVSPNNYV